MTEKYILELVAIGARAILDDEEDTADKISDLLHNFTANSFSIYKSKMYDLAAMEKFRENSSE